MSSCLSLIVQPRSLRFESTVLKNTNAKEMIRSSTSRVGAVGGGGKRRKPRATSRNEHERRSTTMPFSGLASESAAFNVVVVAFSVVAGRARSVFEIAPVRIRTVVDGRLGTVKTVDAAVLRKCRRDRTAGVAFGFSIGLAGGEEMFSEKNLGTVLGRRKRIASACPARHTTRYDRVYACTPATSFGRRSEIRRT